MTLTYRLSNRQRDAIDRGSAVTVAIPVPWHEATPDAYVREVLDVPAAWVRHVEERPITVKPLRGGDGLAGMLGMILGRKDADAMPHGPTLEVLCYVAVVSRRERPVSTLPDQWPGSVEVDGQPWPRPRPEEI